MGLNSNAGGVLARDEQLVTRAWHLAVLPGDGIGPEVIREAISVLHAMAGRMGGLEFDLQEYPVGAVEYLRSGSPLSEDTVEACRHADAILLGAMGLPSVRWPDGREVTPQIDLRERLDLYCGMRPIRLYHPSDTPLKEYQAGDIDLVIVRESTEGLFSARAASFSLEEGATDTLRITRKGAERVCRAAFRMAQKRRGRVTLVDKANVLPSMVFFRSVFDQIADEFRDVAAEHLYVDSAALHLVREPERFDVIVTENMFGDILSDLAAGLVGGMGMAPAADLGDAYGLFQPAHGSAPDIAGQGVANPVAAVLSAALMLEWLDDPLTRKGAALIRAAVESVLANPVHRTPDLDGPLTTREMGELVVQALESATP